MCKIRLGNFRKPKLVQYICELSNKQHYVPKPFNKLRKQCIDDYY